MVNLMKLEIVLAWSLYAIYICKFVLVYQIKRMKQDALGIAQWCNILIVWYTHS